MSESSYQRVKKALDEARLRGESQEDIIEALTSVLTKAQLTALYNEAVAKNKSDLGAAVHSTLFPVPSEPRSVKIGKSIKDDNTVAGAIGKSLRNPVPL